MRIGRFAAFALLAIAALSFGQEFRASISGAVQDASGANVMGARVAVMNVEKNTTSEVATNEAGFYSVPFLLPGRYSVTVEASGFNRRHRDGPADELAQRHGADPGFAARHRAGRRDGADPAPGARGQRGSAGAPVDRSVLRRVCAVAADLPEFPDGGYGPWIRRTVAAGLAGAVLISAAGWGWKHLLFGQNMVPQAGMHIRFGPNNTNDKR